MATEVFTGASAPSTPARSLRLIVNGDDKGTVSGSTLRDAVNEGVRNGRLNSFKAWLDGVALSPSSEAMGQPIAANAKVLTLEAHTVKGATSPNL